MSDAPDLQGSREERQQAFLRDLLPEIKLALGTAIDRHNERELPDRYRRALPDSVLVVTLRPELARAIAPIAGEVEADLRESVRRHGSLYDRSYEVSLREASAPSAPPYRVALESDAVQEAEAPRKAPPRSPAPPPADAGPADDAGEATRIDAPAAAGWTAGRFRLEIVPDEGEASEVALDEPLAVVGRASDDPEYETTIALPEMPHVSRRQLALLWSPVGEEPAFELINLGLNAVRVGDREVPGARTGKGPLALEAVGEEHRNAVRPGERFRVGTSGPDLRVIDGGEPEPEPDPDATVFE
jgi:hypothetical protein